MYDRPPLDLGAEDPLAKIALSVRSGSTVLDIGCAVGRLGEVLVQTKGCVVDGIDVDHDAAALAKGVAYRDVFECDIEKTDLGVLLAGRSYDVVVCADILEHLRDPDALLQTIRFALAPQGRLLLSIPNISHAGVILEMFMGEFSYRDRGLLDKTHIRFYTSRSILGTLNRNGYNARIIARIRLNIAMSEFGKEIRASNIPLCLRQALSIGRDSDVYQFVIEAIPSDKGKFIEPAREEWSQLENLLWKEGTNVSVYWRSNKDQFDEHKKLTRVLHLGSSCERLVFPFRKDCNKSSLRLDPGEEEAYLRLHSLVLKTGARDLWKWNGKRETLIHANHHQIRLGSRSVGRFGMGLWVNGSDPWFEIPVGEAIITKADALEVVMSAPVITSDYLYGLEEAVMQRANNE